MKKTVLLLTLTILMTMAPLAGAATATFEDVDLTSVGTAYTGPGGGYYYDGSDNAGGFTSGGADFSNYYEWGHEGWAVSNTADTTTAEFTNIYSAVTGSGVDGSGHYGVANTWALNQSATISLGSGASAQPVQGFYATNTTYAYLSMLNGDMFAKQFEEDDWFLLTIYALDDSQARTGNSVEFYLAEGTDILSDWTWVDISGLGEVFGLEFDLTSSDTGDWGMNTPSYFAMDNLTFGNPVPVPGAGVLLGSGLLALVGFFRRKE